MFESDDYDQALSQIDFPDICSNVLRIQHEANVSKCEINSSTECITAKIESNLKPVKSLTTSSTHKNCSSNPNYRVQNESTFHENTVQRADSIVYQENSKFSPNKEVLINLTAANNDLRRSNDRSSDNINNHIKSDRSNSSLSPKHVKRKMLNSYFDHKNKRKFPGPAGLLTGSFEEKKDESICQVELLSQDIDFTQNYLHNDVFETPLWKSLLEDTKSFKDINTIKAIKSQALAGNLRRKKAQVVTALVESVDRSAIDPLITLRDKTGNIKCTLHRDAWAAFSLYIVAECCALVLWKPTVLTTGSTYKKHYLNITLSNLSTIYSSAIIDEDGTMPNGFQKSCEEEYTVIRMENKSDFNQSINNETTEESLDILDDLDNVFSDDMF